MAIRLTLLGAVDAAETDTFRTLVVQDFEGIAVKNTDHWAIKFRSTGSGGAGGKEDSEYDPSQKSDGWTATSSHV